MDQLILLIFKSVKKLKSEMIMDVVLLRSTNKQPNSENN